MKEKNPIVGSSSGTSSGSGEDSQRKRKRMISNRESARRSRMRKRKRVDDLTAQIDQLREEKNHITTSVSIATHNYMRIKAENSVLMAQYDELKRRLESLDEIVSNFMNNPLAYPEGYVGLVNPADTSFINPPPVIASAEMLL